MAADTGPAWVRLNADAEPGPRGTMAERRTASRHKEDARMPVRRTILFGAFSHSQMAALPHRRDREPRPLDGGTVPGPSRSPLPLSLPANSNRGEAPEFPVTSAQGQGGTAGLGGLLLFSDRLDERADLSDGRLLGEVGRPLVAPLAQPLDFQQQRQHRPEPLAACAGCGKAVMRLALFPAATRIGEQQPERAMLTPEVVEPCRVVGREPDLDHAVTAAKEVDDARGLGGEAPSLGRLP